MKKRKRVSMRIVTFAWLSATALILFSSSLQAGDSLFPVPLTVQPKKSVISLDELRQGVERGDSEAMKNLGVRYHTGDGVPQDYREAMRLYLAASDKGDKAAPAIIGLMYEDGLGVERDYEQAMRWCKLGHRRGSAVAPSRIGTLYQYGYGVKIDYAEAMRWYRIAERRGLAEAANNIGNLYDHGLGVKQNFIVALRWYLKALKQGSHAAANNIGSLYQFGRGTPQDYAKALRWYRYASEQGDAGAPYNIGRMYEEGWGVQRDLKEAERWYELSVKRGDPVAPEQLADLQRRMMRAPDKAAPCTAGNGDETCGKLPKLIVDLAATDQCREVEWTLPHTAYQLLICPVSSGSQPISSISPTDSRGLIRQAVGWRERSVSQELANGIYTMQYHLDARPQRSLDGHWRVLINHGVWGCKLAQGSSDSKIVLADPCNENRYDVDGRALTSGVPALAIPPYVIEGNTLIIGRLPTSLTAPELPVPDFDSLSASATQLVRAARWGDVTRADKLLAAGIDVNSGENGGETALLSAVQMRQSEMVAFLLVRGADVHRVYPDGMGVLEMSDIVKSPAIKAMLIKAGAKATE